jgi:hypothetical protein
MPEICSSVSVGERQGNEPLYPEISGNAKLHIYKPGQRDTTKTMADVFLKIYKIRNSVIFY